MKRMREARKAAGLTMKELGRYVGVAESTISLYENGKREPDLETLSNIANVLSVSSSWLLGETDNPERLVDRAEGKISDAGLMRIPQIAMMAREMGEMTPEQRDQMLAIGRALMKEYFHVEPESK